MIVIKHQNWRLQRLVVLLASDLCTVRNGSDQFNCRGGGRDGKVGEEKNNNNNDQMSCHKKGKLLRKQ